MTDLLDLPGWKVLATCQDGDEYEIKIESTQHPDACPKCGVAGKVYRHGPKPVTYRDSPFQGRPVRLLAKLQRYRCRGCGATFLQPVKGMQEDRRMTSRCVQYIEEQSLLDNFSRIAEHVGCVEGTVRHIVYDYIQQLEHDHPVPAANWLDIDEVMLSKKLRCVITDGDNQILVDILKDCNKPTAIAWLRDYPHRASVRGVTMPLCQLYRDAVYEILPGIPVVVDKRHVLALVSQCLETVCRGWQASPANSMHGHLTCSPLLLLKDPQGLNDRDRLFLQVMLDRAPDLKAAFELAKDFVNLYELPRAQAIAAFKAWPARVPHSVRPAFKAILNAMQRWEAEMLAFFDYPLANSHTAAINEVAQIINRSGRGYSFDVMRAKLLCQRTGRRKTLQAQRQRCECCQGLFEAHMLEADHSAPIGLGEKPETRALCRRCHSRINANIVADPPGILPPAYR